MSSSETRLFPLLPYLPLHKKPLVSLMVVVEVMVGFCWGIFVPSSTSCLLFGEGMEVLRAHKYLYSNFVLLF